MQVTVAKPGAIDGPGREENVNRILKSLETIIGDTPKVHVSELAAAMIEQCLTGITMEPLSNKDLEEIGRSALQEADYLR